jgi:hypothetical protein
MVQNKFYCNFPSLGHILSTLLEKHTEISTNIYGGDRVKATFYSKTNKIFSRTYYFCQKIFTEIFQINTVYTEI